MIAKRIAGATMQMVAMVPFRSPKSVRAFRHARASRARMKRAMHLAQVAFGEMSVDLRGRDVAVAEHLLHGAQIRAALEQMRGEAMAQGMRADPCKTRISGGPSFERLEKSLPGHRAAESRNENREMCIRDSSQYDDEEYVLEAFGEAGCAGYVVKTDAAAELLSAVRAVHSGRHYLSPTIAPIVLARLHSGCLLYTSN